MEIKEAILKRRSIRRYKPDPVPKNILEDIIETSKWSGSAMNTQPWEIAVIGGEVMRAFKDRLTEKIASQAAETLPFPGMPPGGLPEAYAARSAEYRNTSNDYHFPPGTENLEEKKQAHMAIGGRVHEAPNVLIIYSDKAILNWPWGIISVGMLSKTICLAAMEHGLGTCVMGRPVAWPEILKDLCGIPEDKIILDAIAIGYPDNEARLNNFPRTRIPTDTFVTWHGC